MLHGDELHCSHSCPGDRLTEAGLPCSGAPAASAHHQQAYACIQCNQTFRRSHSSKFRNESRFWWFWSSFLRGFPAWSVLHLRLSVIRCLIKTVLLLLHLLKLFLCPETRLHISARRSGLSYLQMQNIKHQNGEKCVQSTEAKQKKKPPKGAHKNLTAGEK